MQNLEGLSAVSTKRYRATSRHTPSARDSLMGSEVRASSC